MANFGTKVAQIFFYNLSYFENMNYKVKADVNTFCQLLEQFGLLFVPTSGQTVQEVDSFKNF